VKTTGVGRFIGSRLSSERIRFASAVVSSIFHKLLCPVVLPYTCTRPRRQYIIARVNTADVCVTTFYERDDNNNASPGRGTVGRLVCFVYTIYRSINSAMIEFTCLCMYIRNGVLTVFVEDTLYSLYLSSSPIKQNKISTWVISQKVTTKTRYFTRNYSFAARIHVVFVARKTYERISLCIYIIR